LPNVIAVVGVIVDDAVKIEFVVAIRFKPPVAETVKLFAKFKVMPAMGVKTGAALPPDANEYVLLKLSVPAPVYVIVPVFCVNADPNVNAPVVTVIWATAALVPVVKIVVPFNVKDPVVTAILAICVAVLIVPPMLVAPLMTAVPALTFSAVTTAPPG
jgi:hypothetical protein